MKNEITFREKFLVILSYMIMASGYPILIVFMFIMTNGEMIKMHLNRILVCLILNTVVFLLGLKEIFIPFFSINTFLAIISIIGMLQGFLGSNHKLLIIDNLRIYPYDKSKNIKWFISLPIFIIIILVSCIVRC